MNPGKRGTRRVYDGRIINLDIDEVEFPDGSRGQLEMIRHPGASAVVPFLTASTAKDPEIVLIRQYRYAADGWIYEIPAGRLDRSEDPRDCAARELREETGYTAGRIQHLHTMYTSPGFTDERIHLFLAFDLSQGEAATEPDEFVTCESMPLAAAVELVQSGVICDGKTAVALLLASRFVGRG
ncbi:MAG TPA: NUDIX hydrolase [Gemmatimonadaceae bacterium]